jgi:2-aminoadipate transaminase
LIRDVYGRQCRAMQDGIRRHFPAEVTHTEPEGGMFLWAELPGGMAAVDLFDLAVQDKVVFVPGDPFYVRGARHSTLRLNFSCSDVDTIEVGMQRLGKAMRRLM